MKLRIGTRKSKLALAQTNLFAEALWKKGIETEIVHITTAGDVQTEKPLSEIGGRGIFVQEIESALTEGEIDAAIHSAKDLPIRLGDGLEIAAVLERGNPCDCMITRREKTFSQTDTFIIGTGSLRRMAAFGQLFPDAEFRNIRGNVDTRLTRLASGEYDAIILAQAGLERIGLHEDSRFHYQTYRTEEILCAPCQGIIAAECRIGSEAADIIRAVNDAMTYRCFETERFVLALLGAGCTMPIGAYAECNGDSIRLSVTKDSVRRVSGTAEMTQRFELAEELIAEL